MSASIRIGHRPTNERQSAMSMERDAEHGIEMHSDRKERAAEDAHEEEKKINTRSLVYFFRIQIPTKTNVTSTTNK